MYSRNRNQFHNARSVYYGGNTSRSRSGMPVARPPMEKNIDGHNVSEAPEQDMHTDDIQQQNSNEQNVRHVPNRRPDKPNEANRTGFPDMPDMPPPPPYYHGTMYQKPESETAPKIKSEERPPCGEHARDYVPQMPGTPIPDLIGQNRNNTEVPNRVLPVRRTRQSPLRQTRNPEDQNHATTSRELHSAHHTIASENPHDKPVNEHSSGFLANLADELKKLGHKFSAEELLLWALIILLIGQNGDELTILALLWLLFA